MQVTLYSRQNCPLCDEARENLEALQVVYPHKLSIVDVDQSSDLKKQYGEKVPVVEAGPYKLYAPFTLQELQMTLSAAIDREKHIEKVERSVIEGEGLSRVWTRADGFSYWFSHHYLAVLNILVLIYVGLPFLAPALMAAGMEGPARLIYRGYSMACHQLAYRSFFVFGEQPVYPRAAAGLEGYTSFSQASGLSEGSGNDEITAARRFVGTPAMGYKVALCERDVAIYGAILLFGVVFSLTRTHWPRIPWYVWIAFAIVPIAVDGLSQLLSQPPFEDLMLGILPYRESTPLWRVLTGGLFGFFTAWFGYPMVEESMVESRRLLGRKWQRIFEKR